ncbi:hypothetical protein INT43_000043 [Umbelopsis isabellina]|uniref:Cytochrome P450 n=1 Tax=Mortierella isabellina TaxID=91625 RepID=A0A8H7PG59_MORIS|nr:hypothetical protein INT43_000043 [Umbelopsis isabellina]
MVFTSITQIEIYFSSLLERLHIAPENLEGINHGLKPTHIATAAALAVGTLIYRTFSYPQKLSHISHVPAWQWFWSVIRGETNLDRTKKFMLPRLHESGGLVSHWGQFGWEVVLINPELAKAILRKPDVYPKSTSISDLHPETLVHRFLGHSNLVLANGEDWKRRRRIANPAFHRSMPVKAFSQLTANVFQQIDKSEGAPIDVGPLLQSFTLDAIGLVGFGFDFNAILTPDNEWVHTYNYVANNLLEFPFIFFPILDTHLRFLFPKRQDKHKALTKLNDLFDLIIKNKREAIEKKALNKEENEKDLLTLLIESGRGEDDANEPLDDEELRSELVLFFFAGHDTTANALASTLYFLATHKEVQAKARKEAEDVLGDEPRDSWPSVNELKEMTYITCVLKEAARLANPASGIIEREVTEDTNLGGYIVPKGSLLNIDILGVHHNPDYWSDPETFNPDRFKEGGEMDSQTSAAAYLPFGAGTRQCIAGMNFSIAEQRVALSGILRKYEVSLPENSEHKDGLKFSNHLFLLQPKNLKIIFKRRY